MSESRKVRRVLLRMLERAEAEKMLARNHVGHIAFSFHDRINIEPIHYVYDSEWLYGRTTRGEKLLMIEHHPWVAFEVEEIEDLFNWRSVVVKGAFYVKGPDTSKNELLAFERGVALMRAVVPEVLTEDDPTPFRQQLFRIHLDEVSGRESSMG